MNNKTVFFQKIAIISLIGMISSKAYSQTIVDKTWVINTQTIESLGVINTVFDINSAQNYIDMSNIELTFNDNGTYTGKDMRGQPISGEYNLSTNTLALASGEPSSFTQVDDNNFILTLSTSLLGGDGEYHPTISITNYITTTALPLHIVSFKVSKTDDGIIVDWLSEAEESFSHFEIERSLDAKEFQKIGRVNAKGNNSSYKYTDESVSSLLSKTVYYRLKMIDLDESFKYSEIRSIRLDKDQEIAIYPNPVNDDTFKINFNGNEADNFIVKDLSGRTIKSSSISTTEIDVSGLAKGVYLITFLNQEVPINTVKLVKN